MKLPLGQSTQETLINEEDADLAQEHWRLSNTGYAKRTATINGKREAVWLHRVILERMIGALPEGMAPDHSNGDRLDNRRANLRLASQSQNIHNSTARRFAFSKYKGVYWSKQHKAWRAKTHLDGKSIHIGLFKTEQEAAAAFDSWSRQNVGAFGCYNFPADGERGAALAGRRARYQQEDGTWR